MVLTGGTVSMAAGQRYRLDFTTVNATSRGGADSGSAVL